MLVARVGVQAPALDIGYAPTIGPWQGGYEQARAPRAVGSYEPTSSLGHGQDVSALVVLLQDLSAPPVERI